MVLRDNKFATIVNVAILGGRVIGVNLKKFIYLLGSTNVAEVAIFIILSFMDVPAPAGAILILYINLVTDSMVALALGLEPAEDAVMSEGPADPSEALIGKTMWLRILWHSVYSTALFIGYYIGMLIYYCDGQWQTPEKQTPQYKEGLTAAKTCLINLIVASEMLRGYTAKNFDRNDWRFNNSLLNWSVASGILCTIAFSLIPYVNTFFGLNGLAPMDWVGWVTSLSLSFTVFPVDALLKVLFVRKRTFHKHFVVDIDDVPNHERYGLRRNVRAAVKPVSAERETKQNEAKQNDDLKVNGNGYSHSNQNSKQNSAVKTNPLSSGEERMNGESDATEDFDLPNVISTNMSGER